MPYDGHTHLLTRLKVEMSGLIAHIDILDGDILADAIDEHEIISLTPVQHFVTRNTMEPASNGSGIVASEHVATAMVDVLVEVVVGVPPPPQLGVPDELSSFGVYGLERPADRVDLAALLPDGELAVGRPVGDDSLFLHGDCSFQANAKIPQQHTPLGFWMVVCLSAQSHQRSLFSCYTHTN